MKFHHRFIFGLTLVLVGLLAGCAQTPANNQAPAVAQWQQAELVGEQHATRLDQLTLTDPQGGRWHLVSSDNSGLQVLTNKGQYVSNFAGSFDTLDQRLLANSPAQWLIAGVDTTAQQVIITTFSSASEQLNPPVLLPERDFALAGACLYQNQGNSFVFVVGEDGYGEQWLVATGETLLAKAQRIRSLPMPPEAEYCQVDDASSTLFVNEESVGVWAYPAQAEAQTLRTPVALIVPFGDLAGSAGNIAVMPGGLGVLDPDAQSLNLYQFKNDSWTLDKRVSLEGIEEAEQLKLRSDGGQLIATVRDDVTGKWLQHALPYRAATPVTDKDITVIYPYSQTTPVAQHGDAADDPALWIHPSEPARSLILGTNKKAGLQVYTLAGEQVQSLPIGRLNNVDVRSGISTGGKLISLAAASNRDRNSISLFTISEQGKVAFHTEIATPINEIYGLCLYQPQDDLLYAIANGKDGLVIQYQIKANDSAGKLTLKGREVRRFKLASQPEGCVADDVNRQLFIGEEASGVWRVSGDPQSQAAPEMIMAVGGPLVADVEGLALYHDKSRAQPLLVISSQGNDSYVVIDSQPPFALRGVFRVGINAQRGIDGASETDGLEVTSANLGGPWSDGLLVVQDGHNRMPEAPQNFKVIPWTQIAPLLNTELESVSQ